MSKRLRTKPIPKPCQRCGADSPLLGMVELLGQAMGQANELLEAMAHHLPSDSPIWGSLDEWGIKPIQPALI